MNEAELEGKWKQVKGDFKLFYRNLTDEDLNQTKGNFKKVIELLSMKSGKSPEVIKQEIWYW